MLRPSFLLLAAATLVVLVCRACLSFQPIRKPSTQEPLADKEVLAKTMPLQHVVSQTAQMEHLRQVAVNQTAGMIPIKNILGSLNQKDLNFLFHSYLDNVQLLCQRGMKMGDIFSWGNFVCDEDWVRPRTPCLAYTFREEVKDAFFEDDVVRLYGCQVFLFSPGASDDMIHSPNVTLSKESLNTSSLTKIMESTKYQKTPIDVLKMDLNGGEWDALSNMSAAGELSHIRQLVVSLTVAAAKARQDRVIFQKLLVLKALRDAGFSTFHSELRETANQILGVYPVVRTETYDVSLVNTNFPARGPQIPVYVSSGDQEMILLRQLKTPLSDLPTSEEIRILPAQKVRYLYHRFLGNPTIRCDLGVKLGHLMDGGHRLCDDLPYRPSLPCLVYSFGINDNFSFDDDVAKFYGCDVFSFDPSMKKSYRRSDKVTFYKMGVGGQEKKLDRSWRIECLTNIKQLLGHENRTIDILKMDTQQGVEWPALADMARAGELNKVRQLLVEFHLWKFKDRHVPRLQLHVLAELARAGFRLFDSYMNADRSGTDRMHDVYPVLRTIGYKVSFVNTRFQLSSSSAPGS